MPCFTYLSFLLLGPPKTLHEQRLCGNDLFHKWPDRLEMIVVKPNTTYWVYIWSDYVTPNVRPARVQ